MRFGTDNFLGITALSTQPVSPNGLSDFRDESTGFHPHLINSHQIDSSTFRVLITPKVRSVLRGSGLKRGHLQGGDQGPGHFLRDLKD